MFPRLEWHFGDYNHPAIVYRALGRVERAIVRGALARDPPSSRGILGPL
jgi:hypothetical protein